MRRIFLSLAALLFAILASAQEPDFGSNTTLKEIVFDLLLPSKTTVDQIIIDGKKTEITPHLWDTIYDKDQVTLIDANNTFFKTLYGLNPSQTSVYINTLPDSHLVNHTVYLHKDKELKLDELSELLYNSPIDISITMRVKGIYKDAKGQIYRVIDCKSRFYED